MYSLLKKIYWILSNQVGIDFRSMLYFIKGVPRYLKNYLIFRTQYSGKLAFYPCLKDWYEEGGTTKSEYFLQDLYVAQQIFSASPLKHVDVGSRVDGFVAHVASFREIEVFDIRPITSSIQNVIFRQADMMSEKVSNLDYTDSLSCLHALEHFGLGRYGDPLNAKGFEIGLKNMAALIKPGGVFYLSVPIGIERVEFNANWVFNPCTIIQLANLNGLRLDQFSWIQSGKIMHTVNADIDVNKLKELPYSLGIFTFLKH